MISFLAIKRLDRTLPENWLKCGILYDGYDSKHYWWWEIIIKFSVFFICIYWKSWATNIISIVCCCRIVIFYSIVTSISWCSFSKNGDAFLDRMLFKKKLWCCFVEKQSDKSVMQHRELDIEMSIDAFDENNDTSGIDPNLEFIYNIFWKVGKKI